METQLAPDLALKRGSHKQKHTHKYIHTHTYTYIHSQVNCIHPGAVMGTQLASDLALKRGSHTAEQAADAVAAAGIYVY